VDTHWSGNTLKRNKMINPFDEISKKLDAVLASNEKLREAIFSNFSTPKRIPFNDFCKEHKISRVTGYAWGKRGLVKIEKVGGRNFVLSTSISISTQKYQRVSNGTAQ
jgi:hypothetical protein